jgi:hypothetical protein
MGTLENHSPNISKGFTEEMSYGMIGYVVPHSIILTAIIAIQKLPLPFINIASQKNFIALYHMGIYASPDLLKWFTDEFLNTVIKIRHGKKLHSIQKTDQIL